MLRVISPQRAGPAWAVRAAPGAGLFSGASAGPVAASSGWSTPPGASEGTAGDVRLAACPQVSRPGGRPVTDAEPVHLPPERAVRSVHCQHRAAGGRKHPVLVLVRAQDLTGGRQSDPEPQRPVREQRQQASLKLRGAMHVQRRRVGSRDHGHGQRNDGHVRDGRHRACSRPRTGKHLRWLCRSDAAIPALWPTPFEARSADQGPSRPCPVEDRQPDGRLRLAVSLLHGNRAGLEPRGVALRLRAMKLGVVSLTVLLGLAMTACSSQDQASTDASAGVSRVSFLPEQENVPMGYLAGTLGGDEKTGCLWVQATSRQGERVAVRLQNDDAELDVSAQPPVIRVGTKAIAAFGDSVEMGGADGETPAPGCEDEGAPFFGHTLQRATPGAP